MAALSDYSEKALLDWLMGGATPTRPSARYIALFTAAPADSGGGTEVTGSGYARQSTVFEAASSPGGTTQNSGAASFTAAGGNWGAVTHMAILDAVTAGNMLWHGAMTTSRIVNDGDTLTFSIGNIDLTLA